MERVNHNEIYGVGDFELNEKILNHLYNELNKSQNDIADIFDVSRGKISRLLHKYNIEQRTPGEAGKLKSKIYDYDEDYFATVDTYNKAYIVGFINGDGTIIDNSKRKRLNITLAYNDRKILYDIAEEIGVKDLVRLRKSNTYNEQDKVSLTINSTKMCDDVISIGVIPKKTGKENWIKFNNKNLQWAFIRGFFDADGYIRVFERNGYLKSKFTITKSYNILYQLKEFFKDEGIVFGGKGIYQKLGCYSLETQKLTNIKSIYNKLYTYGDLKLERKYEAFNSLMI